VSAPAVAQPAKKKRLDVAETVAFFTGKKAKKLREKLDEKNKEADSIEKNMEEKERKLRILRHTTSSLEEKYEAMTQKKRRELVDEYRQIITKLKQEPFIAGFRVDKEKRVIILTEPIKIKCEGWKRVRNAGQYEIRIDFSQEGFRNGIDILNVTRKFRDYDSPTISKTKPCWGNIKGDIEREFDSQDLLELTIDLVDYISSTNTKAGYLGDEDGKKENGWKVFLDGAKLRTKEYSYEKYDQEMLGRKVKNISITENGYELFETMRTHVETQIDRIRYDDFATASTTMSWGTTGAAASGNDFRMSRMEHELNAALRELGYTERASYYYVGIILNEIEDLERRTGGRRFHIERFDLGAVPVPIRMDGDEVLAAPTRFDTREISLHLRIIAPGRSDSEGDISEILRYDCRGIDLNESARTDLGRVGRVSAAGSRNWQYITMANIHRHA